MRTPINLDDILSEIVVPDMGSAHLALEEGFKKNKNENLFEEKQRKGWDKSMEARCEFTPRPNMRHRAGLYFLSMWQKSIFGRTLTEIKADDSMVDYFVDNLSPFISEVLGPKLKEGGWCIITTPKRRHLVKNFATRIAEGLAERLGIPFYEDVCSCRTKQRVNAVFTVNLVPKEQNIICFDDFVTTGSTLEAMKNALEPYHKNIINFVGINNKL